MNQNITRVYGMEFGLGTVEEPLRTSSSRLIAQLSVTRVLGRLCEILKLWSARS
jgi:hypothetical protein